MTEEQLFQLIAAATQLATANAQAIAEMRQQTTEKTLLHEQEMVNLRQQAAVEVGSDPFRPVPGVHESYRG
ncbi:hypothetical protein [Candidatus Cyanaurora vandensis]|uniref:hypothetical protein n=1 Tax=Candidatus Cyanaurora vandensis TaxID=2714958 RepID=UPI00257F1EC8|nr:hypothetical protein [Candidatus Cyanaurora vandensis]